MKILFAIDESPCAEVAVSEVEERFGMHDTTVRVLHVIEKFVPPANGGVEPTRVRREAVKNHE